MARKKITVHKTLIVDIGTAFASAAVLSVASRNLPHLDKVERVPIGVGSESSRDGLHAHLNEAITALIGKYAKEPLQSIRVVLAAPWHEARIRTVHSDSGKPVSVSEKTILKMVQDYKNEAPPAPGRIDAEAVAVQVRVNGYATQLRKPVAGKRAVINLYESEADPEAEKRITAAISGVFPHARITFHTFPLVSAIALRGLSKESSFFVVDIAGEVTELSIIHDDSFKFLASFPVGYFGIARSFGNTRDKVGDTLSRLALFARGELSEEEQGKVSERFNKSFSDWRESFKKAVEQASETLPIPRTAFLVSDREQLSWLRKGFDTEPYSGIRAEPVSAPMVQNLISLGESGSYDIFLSLAAIFFHIRAPELIGEE